MTSFFKLHKNLIIELTLISAAAFSVAMGGINLYILVFSIVMHELGHIIAALILGARGENFNIHGFGIELTFPGKTLCPRKLLFLSAAGPAASLFVAALAYTLKNPVLFISNLSIAILNLIPAYPLDGGNILACVLSGLVSRLLLRRTMKIIGRIFGVIISLCGLLVLFISGFNISLIYLGLFIFFSADRQQNPVTEITSADYSKAEKSSLFVLDGSISLLEAAANLPINSVGAVKDDSGKITSFVTPLQLYDMLSTYNMPPDKPLKRI